MKLFLILARIATFFAGLYLVYLGLGVLGVIPSTLDPWGHFAEKPAHWTGGFVGFGGIICMLVAGLIDRL